MTEHDTIIATGNVRWISLDSFFVVRRLVRHHRPWRVAALCGIILLAVHSLAIARMPIVGKATLTSESAATGLNSKFHELMARVDGPAWVGYEIPSIRGYRMHCGQPEDHDCLCYLEREHESFSQTMSADSDLAGPSPSALVLYRIDRQRVDRIRCFSADCSIDAGRRPVFWLTDVRPAESIALLESLIEPAAGRGDDDNVGESAVMVIAIHADPGSFSSLEKLAGPARPESVRKQAVFWLGQINDPRTLAVLDRVFRSDPSGEVREQVVFALSCSDLSGALDALIRIAHDDNDPDIRKNALFWLGNKAGEKSVGAIRDAVESDPDTDVKEAAVFALSQLPKDRGVPLLIDVAKTHHNAKIREQAIFWLGQSGDSRALEFFEEVLTH